MKAGKKLAKRLGDRQRDFEAMKASSKHEQKVHNRIESGGYTKPGSMKK